MNFDTFLQTYDMADFIWELFKGISPTFIAIITVVTNNAITKKRNKKDEIKKEINDAQNKAIELMPLILDTGNSLLDYLEHNAEDRDLFNTFLSNNNKMMLKFRQTKYYLNLKADRLNNDTIIFTKLFNKTYEYSVKLGDIHVEYMNVKNNIIDTNLWVIISNKLTTLSNELIDEINDYCKNLDFHKKHWIKILLKKIYLFIKKNEF